MKFIRSLALGLALTGAALAAPKTYQVDKVHSNVVFGLRHLVSQFEGRFRDFSGAITYDAQNVAQSSVDFTVQAASIFTDNEKRDDHLKGDDFFAVSKFPTLTFKSKKVKARGKNLEVFGTITIKGVSKDISVPVTVLGVGPGMGGGEVAGFQAEFKIDRKDFGISAGGADAALGQEVTIRLAVEAGNK